MIAPAAHDLPDLLTPEECAAYLGLDREPGNALERLRTLHRRQGLPRLKRGRFVRYSRTAINTWLEGKR